MNINLKAKVNITITFFLFLFFMSTSVHAANFYVRKGASGNGSNWIDAWSDLGDISGLGNGDTVYIAAGNYTDTFTFGSSGVTVKRATVAEHGSSTGWLNSYDDTVLIHTSNGSDSIAATSRSNITIDGDPGGSDESKFIIYGDGAKRAGKGIYIKGGSGISISRITIHGMVNAGIKFDGASTPITIDDVEIYKCGNGSGEDTNGLIILKGTGGSSWSNYGVIKNSYLHDPNYIDSEFACDIICTAGSGAYFKYYNNTLEPGWTSTNSSDSISIRSSHHRVYNNLFVRGTNNGNQALFLSAKSKTVEDVYIYNNLFYQKSPNSTNFSVWINMTDGKPEAYYMVKDVYILNNTFYGADWAIAGSSNWDSSKASNIVIKNNILHAEVDEIHLGANVDGVFTVDNNFYVQSAGGDSAYVDGHRRSLSYMKSNYGWDTHGWEGDPKFDSISADGFYLTSLSPGSIVGAAEINPGSGMYSDDKDGISRGVTWDVGVYEFDATVDESPRPPKESNNYSEPLMTDFKVIHLATIELINNLDEINKNSLNSRDQVVQRIEFAV